MHIHQVHEISRHWLTICLFAHADFRHVHTHWKSCYKVLLYEKSVLFVKRKSLPGQCCDIFDQLTPIWIIRSQRSSWAVGRNSLQKIRSSSPSPWKLGVGISPALRCIGGCLGEKTCRNPSCIRLMIPDAYRKRMCGGDAISTPLCKWYGGGSFFSTGGSCCICSINVLQGLLDAVFRSGVRGGAVAWAAVLPAAVVFWSSQWGGVQVRVLLKL